MRHYPEVEKVDLLVRQTALLFRQAQPLALQMSLNHQQSQPEMLRCLPARQRQQRC
ncbi:hypothetical protein MTE1_4963 [Klebsiella pneumoniae JHCK1]|nr:hypothetical protein MTE1_4963 [Klebsiella pneumoniae JHCK1]